MKGLHVNRVMAVIAFATGWVPAAVADPADPILGRWAWYTGQLVWVTPKGELVSERGGRGSWKPEDASKRAYHFSWDGGRWSDHVTLSANGDAITGINTMGRAVAGHRVADRLVGRYATREGAILTTAENHAAWSSRFGGGRWDAIDVEAGKYRLSWPGEHVGFDVELSADGLVLAGPEFTAHRLSLPLMGRWRWFNGADVVMRPDGSAGTSDGQRGGAAWRLVDAKARAYQVDWASEYVDEVVVSADGLRLEGKNDRGQPVSARREPVPAVAGPWIWSDGRELTVRADGGLVVANTRGPWDGWVAVDPARRLHRFVWGPSARVEDLTLSEDAQTLSSADGTLIAERRSTKAKAKAKAAKKPR